MSKEVLIPGLRQFLKISSSVIRPFPASKIVKRNLWNELGNEKITPPSNIEDAVLHDFITLVQDKSTGNGDFLRLYWDGSRRYEPSEVFNLGIQFLDIHDESLPETVLPPAGDVERYATSVLNSGQRLTLDEQFDLLLDISGGNVVGAANLGFITSRLYARGLDLRAYPDVRVDEPEMRLWNKSVAQFDVYDGQVTADASGDTYYFWTHFFARTAFSLNQGVSSDALKTTFSKGTEIMRFARKYLAGSSTVSPHHEASQLGINVAEAVCYTLKEKQAGL